MTLIELREMCAKICDTHRDKSATLVGATKAMWCAEDIRAIQLPEQEPLAWMNPTSKAIVAADLKIPGVTLEDFDIPLYAAPPSISTGEQTVNDYLTVESLEKLVVELQLRIDGRFHNGLKWHSPGMGEVHSHDHKYEIQCMVEIPETPEGQDQIACTDLADKVCDALNEIDVMKKQVAELKESLRQVLDEYDHSCMIENGYLAYGTAVYVARELLK
ncbi:hypothetical protein ACO0K2_18015 [Undibacterium sp. MH2W]|uniref:hypothetical protein n=1 Tax=Undibacterium sp. MH2W TaxID=3413044 RepID=UPI003BF3530F